MQFIDALVGLIDAFVGLIDAFVGLVNALIGLINAADEVGLQLVDALVGLIDAADEVGLQFIDALVGLVDAFIGFIYAPALIDQVEIDAVEPLAYRRLLLTNGVELRDEKVFDLLQEFHLDARLWRLGLFSVAHARKASAGG